jgi:hypothetical protein
MVKLNEDAFAAVHAAFPGAKEAEHAAASSAQVSNSSNNKRKGVGAVHETSPGSSTDLQKRVLQVGRKKRRNLHDDDDEEDMGMATGDAATSELARTTPDDDGDEEEDLGRTGIDPGVKPLVDNSVESLIESASPKKKKKKAGKRERQAQKEAQQDVVAAATKAVNSTLPLETSQGSEVGTADSNASTKSQKRKRPKIRSRQKNIRKDNRAAKPLHLVPGSKDYRGRPLTTETRTRLSLGPSQRIAKLKSYWVNEGQEGNDKGNSSRSVDVHERSSDKVE